MESWTKAVPDELRRAFYMRIYKWVVAFATWRSIDPTAATITATAKSASKAKAASSAAATAGDHHEEALASTSTIISSCSSSAMISPPSSSRQHTGRSDKLSIDHHHHHSPHHHSPHHHSPHRPSPGAAYATRQARSKVVAHEALKKGKKVRLLSVARCTAE